MPNHITNILTASKEVIDFAINDDGDYFDFSLLIPETNKVKISIENNTLPLGDTYWLDWRIDNWGTKWNSYSQERLADDQIRFDTAWNHPFPIIVSLSEKFPEETIIVMYADEDISYNLGSYTIKNGEIINNFEFVEGSDEAFDFAANLKYNISGEELRKQWDED